MIDPKSVAHIFRSYDIRGIYEKDLDEEIMYKIGNVLGQYAKNDVVVGRDIRISSEKLHQALINGVIHSGKNVFDIGLVPMGTALFYAWQNDKTLAYITASHLPKEWNGVKFFHSNGLGFLEHENFKIRDMFLEKKFIKARKGQSIPVNNNEVLEEYKKYLLSKVSIGKKLKMVIDCANGCAGLIAPDLFQRAGFEVETIFEKPDGNFPNRLPNPVEPELSELKKLSKNADVGIAYDGDGDRMALIDDQGRFVTPEQTSYLILLQLLKKERGPIVANVECTRMIDNIAKRFSRKVYRFPVGHTFLMQAIKEHKACFGVESAGHYALPSLILFDDSMAISLYVASVLSNQDRKLSEIIEKMPKNPFKRVSFECPDEIKFKIIDNLKEELSNQYKDVNTLDGVRVDFPHGWVLIRASNTSPYIRLTVEGITKKDFEEIQNKFLKILEQEMKKFGLGMIPEFK